MNHSTSVQHLAIIFAIGLMCVSGASSQQQRSGQPLASARIASARQVEADATASDPAPADAAPVPAPVPDAPAAPVDGECPEEEMSFEMVTGFVYTAPSDMLDSQPGTLMLTDCIDTCRKNSSCKSINYETGLCVLFSSNADEGQGEDRVYKLCDTQMVEPSY